MLPLELWGGHECTVNRVGRAFFDQTIRTGHHERVEDLERFRELGITALRYPVLWERVAPRRPERRDWRWTDERLAAIRDLGMRPIVGLLHHGSGPRYTGLLDHTFPQLFADYARAAAERYPWVDEWTPINEPLTTARFSALYGFWHPHAADERSFWTALINEIEATCLAMREIRRVNPAARLIQTEDLGRTYATPALANQADYDNTRRWMTWDLLCGRVTRGHLFFERLDGFGLGERLRTLADDPCPPDVIGINHYLTSDRFLDHRVEDYPRERRGGNGVVAYADVEAVRVAIPAPGGLEGALDEAWRRYDRPLAVAESHNGCTREEQMRWFRDAWETALRLRACGADVRAVTAWALLGSFDWNSLLTRAAGHYEVGAFDVRPDPPRATALAAEIRRLASGGGPAHPAAAGAGWWRRDLRLQFRPAFRTLETPEPRREWRAVRGGARPLLITGATGTLGKALARACEWRGIDYRLTSRAELPLDGEDTIARVLDDERPWAVINAAGWVRVDAAEKEPYGCLAANRDGAIRLARLCAERAILFVSYSSDLVFDGLAGRPYVESDPPSPLNVYGDSKAQAERTILSEHRQALIIRTAAFFSPYDRYNFAAHVLRSLAAGLDVAAAADLVVSPTYVPDLVTATLDLLIDGDNGVRHLVNESATTWHEFGTMLAREFGYDEQLVLAAPAASFGWAAARPPHAPLSTERGWVMPDLQHALARYAAIVREFDFKAEAEALADLEHPDLLDHRKVQAG